jgi:hypothetical protein
MEDQRLGDLLRELPREQARPDFTARVLQRLASPQRAPRPNVRLVLAAAALTVAAVSAGVLIDRQADSRPTLETAQARRVLQDLRSEHERLQREVRELSQLPMVYIGGNEDVDLVLDLGQVREAEGATPAAYRDETF